MPGLQQDPDQTRCSSVVSVRSGRPGCAASQSGSHRVRPVSFHQKECFQTGPPYDGDCRSQSCGVAGPDAHPSGSVDLHSQAMCQAPRDCRKQVYASLSARPPSAGGLALLQPVVEADPGPGRLKAPSPFAPDTKLMKRVVNLIVLLAQHPQIRPLPCRPAAKSTFSLR